MQRFIITTFLFLVASFSANAALRSDQIPPKVHIRVSAESTPDFTSGEVAYLVETELGYILFFEESAYNPTYMSLYPGYFAAGFGMDPWGTSVLIKMDCILIEETWCKCKYQCVELGKKSDRQDRAGGQLSSEDVPYPFTKIKIYKQLSNCPKTKKVPMQVDKWEGLGDCSKKQCKTACKSIFTLASKACKAIPNPILKKACQVVAAAAKQSCKSLCADCPRP